MGKRVGSVPSWSLASCFLCLLYGCRRFHRVREWGNERREMFARFEGNFLSSLVFGSMAFPAFPPFLPHGLRDGSLRRGCSICLILTSWYLRVFLKLGSKLFIEIYLSKGERVHFRKWPQKWERFEQNVSTFVFLALAAKRSFNLTPVEFFGIFEIWVKTIPLVILEWKSGSE